MRHSQVASLTRRCRLVHAIVNESPHRGLNKLNMLRLHGRSTVRELAFDSHRKTSMGLGGSSLNRVRVRFQVYLMKIFLFSIRRKVVLINIDRFDPQLPVNFLLFILLDLQAGVIDDLVLIVSLCLRVSRSTAVTLCQQ